MSVANWYRKQYVDGVLEKLGTDGYLTKGMAMTRTGVRGDTVEWHIAGDVTSHEMAPGIEEQPYDEHAHDVITAQLKDYGANSMIRGMDIYKMPENQKQIAQKATAKAIGKRYDTIFMDALNAASLTTIGDGSAAISVVDLVTAQTSIFGSGDGIDTAGEIYAAVPYKFLAQLMMYKEFSSSDYSGAEMAFKKKLGAKSYLGMHVVPLPDAYFPVPAANQIDAFIWKKEALGVTTPTDAEGKIAELTRIDYVPTKKAYLVAATMSAAAKVLQPAGVRRLRFATNIAIARPS